MALRLRFKNEEVTAYSSLKLQRIVSIKIVALLLNSSDVATLMSSFHTLEGKWNEWIEVEKKVSELVSHLVLPETIKEQMLKLVKSMSEHVYYWKFYHSTVWCIPYTLYWTQQGTIDRKKTAKAVVKDRRLDFIIRCIFACVYCFETDITELWGKMLERYENPGNVMEEARVREEWKNLVSFWIDVMTEQISLHDLEPGSRLRIQKAFWQAVHQGNKESTEFFLAKLHSEDREMLLWNATYWNLNRIVSCEEYFVENSFFLLSHFGLKELSEMFDSDCYEIISFSLVWPWHDLFLQMASRLLPLLPDNSGGHVLDKLMSKMVRGYGDYDYRNLFTEFWMQCPDDHKEYFILEREPEKILFDLYAIGDLENIRLIMKEVTVEQREEIISYARECSIKSRRDTCTEWYFEKSVLDKKWPEFVNELVRGERI